MLAVDTNVIVRYLLLDDQGQTVRAQQLVDQHDVWVPLTVLLETEWVLRRQYRFPPAVVLGRLAEFVGLPTVTVEDPGRLRLALEWGAQGMDFADALHRASAADCDSLATFDADFIRHAAGGGHPPVLAP